MEAHLNTKLLKRVAAAILKHPDQFEMAQFFRNYLSLDFPVGGCGTAGCIGGWGLHLAGKRKTLRGSQSSGGSGSTWSRAQRLFGLDDIQASLLFQLESWPTSFFYRYEHAKTPLVRARAAADRIDHFIKTKGAE